MTTFDIKPFEDIKGVRIGFLDETEQHYALSNNAYFRYVLFNGAKFCSFLKCQDVTPLLTQWGYRAYNYKDLWESRGLRFERAIMLFLLSKVEPFSHTVGQMNDYWIREEDWVLDMYQKNFIQAAFRVVEK